MRPCKICGLSKPATQFNKDRHVKDGLSYKCKTCMNEYRRSTYHRRAETEKLGAMRRKYGLTPEQYRDMIKDGCLICGSYDGLAIDHDHSCCPGRNTCGKCIRGTLCRRCNTAEGMFKNDPDMMLKLFKYIVE